MNKFVFSCMLLSSLISLSVVAQDLSDLPPPVDDFSRSSGEEPVAAGSGQQVKVQPGGKKQKLQLGFDDELVRGKLNNPEVDYLFARKQFNFKKLIKLREDFIPEVQKGKVEFGAGD